MKQTSKQTYLEQLVLSSHFLADISHGGV